MNTNQATTYAPMIVQDLLNVIALANMYKINCRKETRECALDWMPQIESCVAFLRRELESDSFDE